MTKNKILDALYSKVGDDDFEYIQEEMVSEMEQCENQFDFIQPILKLMEDNPDADFGMPGALTHFIENFKFYYTYIDRRDKYEKDISCRR